MELGDARLSQQAFDGINPADPGGDVYRSARIPSDETRREQIELQEIAHRLEISRIRRQCGVDLSVEPVGQN